MKKTDSLARHLLVEVYGCTYERLNETARIEKIMKKAVELAKATFIQSVFHKFSPHGVSGVIVVAESHFSIHTWPEHGYCGIDIFTCDDRLDTDKAIDYLKAELHAKKISVMEIKRGDLLTAQKLDKTALPNAHRTRPPHVAFLREHLKPMV